MLENETPQSQAEPNEDLTAQPELQRVAVDPGESIRHKLELENTILSGANWFFWIAGLSILNSLLFIAGTDWGFVIGLGVTQIVDGFAIGMKEVYATNTPLYVAFVIDVIIAGVFALIGYFARQKREYVFIAGMAFFAVDGTLFLMVFDIIGLAFHALALVFIYKGYKAIGDLQKLQNPIIPEPAPEPTPQKTAP